jgi:anti-sigma factor RsiW
MTSRTPDWLLERVALGELPADELARARARLAQEPEGKARLAALEADNARVLALRPPSAVAREIQVQLAREELTRPARSARPLWTGLAMVGALVVFVLIMGRAGDEPFRPRDTPERRQAGAAPRLELVREDTEPPEPLANGDRAAAGDVVRLSYGAAGARYGALLSVDDRGVVTLHAPEAGAEALALEPLGLHALPRVYVLNDAPSFERFFLVTSGDPFPVNEVRAAALVLATSENARTAPLPLPEAFGQVSLTLDKRAP